MFIQVDHDTGESCYAAVLSKLDTMNVGESIEITGMKMGGRVIHAEVVRALIHAAGNDTFLNYRTSMDEDGTGWGRVMHVTCTGTR